MGYLDDTNDLPDLEKGCKMNLPLWAALPLSEKGIVKIQQPSYFSQKFQLNLAADPSVINLNDRCPYFYELGMKLCAKYSVIARCLFFFSDS